MFSLELSVAIAPCLLTVAIATCLQLACGSVVDTALVGGDHVLNVNECILKDATNSR